MTSISIQAFVDTIRSIVARAEIAPGTWRRYTRVSDEDRDQTANPYGCADALNLLSTIDEMPRDDATRKAAVAALQGMQSNDGMFHEATHHQIHCTAHCLAALKLLDAGPARPLSALAPYTTPEAIGPFLDQLDWNNPWGQSHQGAGIYAALHLAGETTPAWEDAYFEWLWNEADPTSGWWRRGYVAPLPDRRDSVFPHLAGSFHYLFNHEHARRPLRYPEAWIDTCLTIGTSDPYPLGTAIGFAEIDWVYALTRAQRQTQHRYDEVKQALRAFAERYVAFLMSLDPNTHPRLNDLHALFGATCCLAELQAALPGLLRSDKPLHLVLDRRPFI
ncbi:MAG: hypothetical protein PF961_11845 [Planctomycetota bacterium]|jgi:hypothetical protein|nr:hypothetical protein [Planctomycetota bacterium]